jgi:hypothetical protein
MTDPAQLGMAIRALFLLACLICAVTNRQLALRMTAVFWAATFLPLPIYTTVAMRESAIGPEVGAVVGAALLVPCGALVRGVWRGMSWAMVVMGLYSVLMVAGLLWLTITTVEGPQENFFRLLSWVFMLGICVLQLRDSIGAAQLRLAEQATDGVAAVEGQV